jgi:DNA-directed RNA polymerase subunit alpha
MTPAVKVEARARKYGRFRIDPLPAGFGVTLGNALRRTLLSQVRGAAITAVKVAGVPHEFSTIPHAREDMTALILNLKQVRLRFKEDRPATMSLKLRGEGEVTAGDLVCPPHVEVVNPELILLSGDSAEAQVDLTLTAQAGAGYSPSEEREPGRLGTIPIDAVFSPVTWANFKVQRSGVAETVRSGGGFDKLSVELKTDGSLSPEAALREASEQLSEYFARLAGQPYQAPDRTPANPYRRTLDRLGLPNRAANALRRARLYDVNAIMKRARKGDLGQIRGLGEKSYADLLAALEQQPLSEDDRAVLGRLRVGAKARTILARAARADFKALEYDIDQDAGQVWIGRMESAQPGQGAARRLLEQLKAAGYSVIPEYPDEAALPFWRKMYAEGLIAEDPDSLERAEALAEASE